MSTTEERLAAACRRPFSNGTEERSWQSRWCEHCAHDHEIHTDRGPGCDVYLQAMVSGFTDWPECWLPEPDDGEFFMPSRLVCQQFTPCEQDGCNGDPYPETRGEIVAEVRRFWQTGGDQ